MNEQERGVIELMTKLILTHINHEVAAIARDLMGEHFMLAPLEAQSARANVRASGPQKWNNLFMGSLALGMGDKVDHKASKMLTAGGYGVAPANMHHFAWTKAGAIVQVNLMGPFAITYVNPADDPTHGK